MKVIKIILIFFAAAILFLLSETIFLYNHPNELSIYAIAAAKRVNSTGNVNASFFILTRSAGIISAQNYSYYPVIVQKDAYRLNLPNDTQFKSNVANYLNSLPGNVSDLRGKYDLARVFYDFALFASNDGLNDLTPKLLSISLDLNPSLSYWSVELANYYLYNNQPDTAKKILDNCMTIEASRQHCQNYYNDSFINDNPGNVGFIKSTVDGYYESGAP